jgi:hypothetical protein
MTVTKRLSLITALGVFLNLLMTAQAFGFTFTQIADTTSDYSKFGFYPAIDNDGTIAFLADLNTGGSGLFKSIGGEITRIDDGQFSSFFSFNPALQSNGNVAFSGSLKNGGSAIYALKEGALQEIATSSNLAAFGSPAINSEGTVAFSQILDSGVRAVLTSNGETKTILTDNNDTSPYSRFEGTAINKAGAIAFSAEQKIGGRGIYVVNGGVTNTIADTSGEFDFLFNPTINDEGTVAFKGTLDALAGEGIYTGNGAAITKIADNSGVFDFFLDNPAINNKGTVAFKGVLKGGGLGIYTGADPIANKVIALGDSLSGSTVTDLYFSNQGINDSNQFAFYARLADGRRGIFRADSNPEPQNSTSIPEASSLLGLFVVGALGITLRLKHLNS